MAEGKWFVRTSGHIRGPFSVDQLLQLHHQGQLDRLHDVSQDRATWSKAGSILDQFVSPGGPSRTLPSSGAAVPPAQPPRSQARPVVANSAPRGNPATGEDFNPYAAPETSRSADRPLSDPNEGRGVWQDGDVLVMAKIARLPMRCVKCNEPATNRLRRTLYWHNPLLYLLLLSPVIYIIVALIVRKTLTFEVPLCDEHRARRRGAILFSWLLGLAGLALCFAPAFNSDLGPAVLVGLILIVFSLIYGTVRSQIVTPLKIDDTHAWIKKVGPPYLATLPRLPSPYENPNRPRIAYDVEL